MSNFLPRSRCQDGSHASVVPDMLAQWKPSQAGLPEIPSKTDCNPASHKRRLISCLGKNDVMQCVTSLKDQQHR